jgi:hypothetical protein
MPQEKMGGRVGVQLARCAPGVMKVKRQSIILIQPTSMEVSKTKVVVPSSSKFKDMEVVKVLLKELLGKKAFAISSLKRGMQSYLKLKGLDEQGLSGMQKPNGLHVEEMYDPKMFNAGVSKLNEDAHTLKVPLLEANHIRSCKQCCLSGRVEDSCYFSRMILCITNGWRLYVEHKDIAPRARLETHYKSVDTYKSGCMIEVNKMIKHQVLVPAPENMKGIVNPIGAIIKNGDIMRAKVLTGIIVKDQVTLAEANLKLKILGLPEIKIRVATDLSATGVNRAAYKPPFRYPSLHDALDIIEPNDWLAKGDVTRYFFLFPIAQESLWMFLVSIFGVLYILSKCCFGFAACPYYCSTWSAEFRKWAIRDGIPCSHMMDDWLTRGGSRAEAAKRLHAIYGLLEPAGVIFAREKEEIGQRLVHLGILIDAVSMTLSFEKTQARAMSLQLVSYKISLSKGSELDLGTIRHVAGKLTWFSEALQEGRCHVRSWWIYMRYGKELSVKGKLKLISDTDWWIAILQGWADDELNGNEYPILSASRLLECPELIHVVQSDASGIDGFGYLESSLQEDSPRYVARTWDDPYMFGTSHNGELQALLHFVDTTDARGRLLLWVSDCLAAVWSVLKGRCYEELALETLERILRRCDEKKLQLVAFWIPREQNLLPDYLSHLCVYMNSKQAGGSMEDL